MYQDDDTWLHPPRLFELSAKRPISQIPQRTYPISHIYRIGTGLCTFLFQSGTLWDMEDVRCEICDIGLFAIKIHITHSCDSTAAPALGGATGTATGSRQQSQRASMTSQWARWRLKSPASLLFTQLFIQAQIKETTSKLRVTGRCGGNSPVTGEYPAHRASSAVNVSISWRHHEYNLHEFVILSDKGAYQLSDDTI